MNEQEPRKSIQRSEFLKLLGAIGGAAGMAAFLSACEKAGLDPQSFTPSPDLKLVPTGAPTSISSSSPTDSVPQSTNQPTQTSEPANPPDESGIAKIALVKTSSRSEGVRKAIELFGVNSITNKDVFIKPNFNSADPSPGSTHPEVLRELVLKMQEMGASNIEVGDRSGMGNTRQVMQNLGVFDLAAELGFKTLVLDELEASGWEIIYPQGSHWKQGFPIARACIDSGAVVQACCLKTHRYGGHFTMSLKNSVGLVAKQIPGEKYNYMSELHNSAFQRLMIAEINTAYQTDLILMDGLEAFVSGGPDQGKLVRPEVMLAGRDRVAIDAVGVAILRYFGTTPEVASGRIFDLEQIAHAVELGIGIQSSDQIQIVAEDDKSKQFAAELQGILDQG